MRKLSKLALLTVLVSGMLTSCSKKDDDATEDEMASVNGLPASPKLNPNAAGAFYAIHLDAITSFGGTTDTMKTNTAMAWFGTYTPSSKDGGTVSCNNVPLVMSEDVFGTIMNYPWYSNSFNATSVLEFKTTTPLAWKASGNSGNNVPAINYTDNGNFGTITNFNVPATGSINNPLTFSFKFANYSSGDNDQLIYLVGGSKGTIHKVIPGTTTSITLTAAEISSIAVAHDNLTVELVPIKIKEQTISGKLYAFVREYAVAKFVEL